MTFETLFQKNAVVTEKRRNQMQSRAVGQGSSLMATKREKK